MDRWQIARWQIARWQLDWPFGTAEIISLGGMLGPVNFRLPDGRALQPMYLAPWLNDPATPDLPPLLRHLRGEFPCVPFGRTDFPEGLDTPLFQSSSPGLTRGSTLSAAPVDARVKPGHDEKIWERADPRDGWEHGYSANQPWSLISADRQHVRIGIDYPESSPIARLERQVSADPEQPALDLSLTIWARQDATLPVALHPTFRTTGGVRVLPGPFTAAIAYPVPTETDVSQLIADGRSADLAVLPALSGPLDLTRLPLPVKTEELLQLKDCKAPFSLYYETEGVTMTLWWDQDQLPDVMLWVSNGGRAGFPWNGRNYALGIEPVNGAFDLGRVAAPPADHPLATRRGLTLRKGKPLRLDYRIAVQ
ncbi:hypothetical protein [Dongia sp.]|uniref:hypothetical protein n=1 Tax=Dongia sp. TaxID=1977262 RepID=UPI0035B228B7